jgi:sugar/nucleoside kinase (ribokinase family)
MSLLITGSLGIDTVITPTGTATDVLGGSAVYASFAASPYTQVRMVGVVGEDFPKSCRDLLASRGIDLRGLETRKGSRTFRWTGKYSPDMNDRETVSVELNVLAEAGAKVPPDYTDSEVVFLANTHPTLQRNLAAAVKSPRLTVCDTMDLWINTARDELLATLKIVDGLIINDSEARLLTGKVSMLAAGDMLLEYGPKFAVIKKGEHGSILVTRGGVTVLPAYPTRAVKDPTGAGDAFAGGMLGYMTSQPDINDAALRRSLLHGTVAASFAIEDYSLDKLKTIGRRELDARAAELAKMMRIE